MIRQATAKDLDAIMEIVKGTIAEMKKYGNTQWDEDYPNPKVFLEDIKEQHLYVSQWGSKTIGFICVDFDQPEEYKELNFKEESSFMVIHRMAIHKDFRYLGNGTALLEHAQQISVNEGVKSIRTDTNITNEKMQKLFKNNGFKHVGNVHFKNKANAFCCYEKQI